MASTLEDNQQIAQKLYNDEFVSIQPEEYTSFLASDEDDSTVIRELYMDLFQWDDNLLTSTRQLCTKLHLKGESQEIDRILTSFTQSYLKQHPTNVFATKSFEKIYIVMYSLILLNTSLHNSEVSKKSKITQADYIRNTFSTFVEQEPRAKLSIKQRITIERELAHFYDDLVKDELHLRASDPETTKSMKRMSVAESLSAPKHKKEDAHDTHTQEYGLTKQTSNGSIWSTETSTHRNSLAMKRMSSATSGVSNFSVTQQRNGNSRVGFTRALMSDTSNQRFYNQQAPTNSGGLRGRPSVDTLRNGHVIQRRSSKVSMISRDSLVDDMSVVSLSTEDLQNIEFADDAFQQNLEDFNVSEYQDRYDLQLELQGSPYLKEGLLKLKILNNDQQDNNAPDSNMSSAASTVSTTSNTSRFFSFFSRRAHVAPPEASGSLNTSNVLMNKFMEYFVVVSKGELRLYSFDPKVIKKHKDKVKKFKQKQRGQLVLSEYDSDDAFEPPEDKGDGNWLKNAANVGNYNLCSTFAQVEKASGSGRTSAKNPNIVTFSVTFPRISKKPNKKFVFEAGTKEIALEFVNTCNFWASKITATPTNEETITSIEYGWTNLDALIGNKPNFKRVKTIQKYEPMPTGIYLSGYGENSVEDHSNMMKQFTKTLNYYNHLKKTFREFSEMKLKFVHNFQSSTGGSNYSRVMANYDVKLAEYKNELRKYKNYLIILGFGLQLRFDLEDDEKAKDEEATVDGSDESQRSDEDESELSKTVKYEIRKLFVGLKDVGRIIPTFQTSKSISNLHELQAQIPNLTVNDFNSNFSLVKSPKTYTLSYYNDDASPVNQLLQTTNRELGHSHSTSTIREEEEPEDI